MIRQGFLNLHHPIPVTGTQTNTKFTELAYMCSVRVFIRDTLAYIQVVTNCQYSVAQMCTQEECMWQQNQPNVLYFNNYGTFSEKKRLIPLWDHPGVYQGSGSSSCTTPRQPTINDWLQFFSESKCPELLANYCDMLLRKTPLSKKLTSDEVEAKLRDVLLVLKYVQVRGFSSTFYFGLVSTFYVCSHL